MDIAVEFKNPNGITPNEDPLNFDLAQQKQGKNKKSKRNRKNKKKKNGNSNRRGNTKWDSKQSDITKSENSLKSSSPEEDNKFRNSVEFGKITFSDVVISDSDKSVQGKMFQTDGVQIVPHDFVKNFIQNQMQAVQNVTTDGDNSKTTPKAPIATTSNEIETSLSPRKEQATTFQTNTSDILTSTSESVTTVIQPSTSPSLKTEDQNILSTTSVLNLQTNFTEKTTLKSSQTSDSTITKNIVTTDAAIQKTTVETNKATSTVATKGPTTKPLTTERSSSFKLTTLPESPTKAIPTPAVKTTQQLTALTTQAPTTIVKQTTAGLTTQTQLIKTTQSQVVVTTRENPIPTVQDDNTTSTHHAINNITTSVTDKTTEIDVHDEDLDGGIMPEDVGNSTDVRDVDTVIFPSFRADIKKRRQERKRFCYRIDFGDIKKGFQCCKRTLNCFDDLPENLDETVFHEGTHEYNEHERLHVCSHIDDAIRCKEALENRPVCRKAGSIMDQTIKPQMDKVKLFYYNHCNRGTPIGPSVLPPDPGTSQSNPPSGGKGSEHLHTQAGSYAPFIGGAIMGVFVLALIVLIAVYCRKRSKKNKRSKEQRCDSGRESSESSRYKAVTYNRRKSEIYAEIDEKSMVSCVSLALDGQSCSTDIVNLSQGSISSRKYPSAPSIRQVELDNHGYLSPQSIFSEEDPSKPDVIPNETNLTKDGYITLSESGDSAQSYAKLEAEPEDVYIHPDQIETSPNKLKKTEGQRNTYFILEKTDE